MINKTDKELVKININNHKVYYPGQQITMDVFITKD